LLVKLINLKYLTRFFISINLSFTEVKNMGNIYSISVSEKQAPENTMFLKLR